MKLIIQFNNGKYRKACSQNSPYLLSWNKIHSLLQMTYQVMQLQQPQETWALFFYFFWKKMRVSVCPLLVVKRYQSIQAQILVQSSCTTYAAKELDIAWIANLSEKEIDHGSQRWDLSDQKSSQSQSWLPQSWCT